MEEKRALQEISQWKRSRRIVEAFQADQDAIDAERAKADELRKQRDDPVAQAASARYDEIKKELDAMKKESDDAWGVRNKLLDERTALQGQLDDLWGRKRESAGFYKDANDKFYTKLNEDRARRQERFRQQRQEQEEAKKKEMADRIRDEADVPAYQAQIEDCQTLIDHFSGKAAASAAALSSQKPLFDRTDVAGVPKLEIRQVAAAPEGIVVRKKKGEDEESYFVGGGKKKGGKKAKPAASEDAPVASSQLNVPLPILTALLSLSIPPPASTADVPRVIEDLKTKKTWFEANQARATTEAKAKAEVEIRKLLGSKPADGADVPDAPSESAEAPAEPVEDKVEAAPEQAVEA